MPLCPQNNVQQLCIEYKVLRALPSVHLIASILPIAPISLHGHTEPFLVSAIVPVLTQFHMDMSFPFSGLVKIYPTFTMTGEMNRDSGRQLVTMKEMTSGDDSNRVRSSDLYRDT